MLCVLSIGRMGRNYEEVQNRWRVFAMKTGIDSLSKFMRSHKRLGGQLDTIYGIIADGLYDLCRDAGGRFPNA